MNNNKKLRFKESVESVMSNKGRKTIGMCKQISQKEGQLKATFK